MARHRLLQERGRQGRGLCFGPDMDDPPRHESPLDRIARAVARLNAATVHVNRAEAALIAAEERLALARLALEHARVQDVHDWPTDDVLERIRGEA